MVTETFSKTSNVEDLVASLAGLIDALIASFPEGVDEGFNVVAYLTLLGKAQEDVTELSAAIMPSRQSARLFHMHYSDFSQSAE